jgi:excisionase family DNA binding protein
MLDEHVPQVMNVHEVADYLRVAPATIYRLAQAGKIPCGKVGRAWRFRKAALDEWISEKPISLDELSRDSEPSETRTEYAD